MAYSLETGVSYLLYQITDLYVHVKHFSVQESACLSGRKDPSLEGTTILCKDSSTGSLICTLSFLFEGVFIA